MKIKCISHCFWLTELRKALLIMKILILLLTVVLTHVSASSFSQKVTIIGENLTVEKVFKEIEKQIDVNFFYRYNEVRDLPRINLSLKNTELIQVMNKLFDLSEYSIHQEGKTIIINRKSVQSLGENRLNRTGEKDVNQQFDITGKVVDAENGKALNGASIQIKNSNLGTATNINGEFALQAVKEGDIIKVGYTGYKSVEVKVTDRKEYLIKLLVDVGDLDEVVVTGYTTQIKREMTGSISAIKADQVSGAMTTSIDGAMQGRMSGVNVQSSVGIPGAGIRVRVRGAGSISAGNDPIYVLDGVVLNTTATSHTISTNPLNNIDPVDILSIEVLKDAAAASVYGAQAANGVVLITTKKGREGRTDVDFTYRRGYVTPVRLMDVLNTQDYLSARFEAVKNSNPLWSDERVKENVLRASQLPTDLDDIGIASLPTYDWQKASYQTGESDKYNLAVGGGKGSGQYRISFGYENTDGAIIASKFIRGTINMNYVNKLSTKLELATTVNLSTLKQAGPLGSLGTTTQFSAPSYASPMMLPFIPIYNEKGELNVNHAGFPGTFKRNIIHSSLFNEHNDINNSMLTNLKINYAIGEKFAYRIVAGVDYRDGYARNYYDPRTSDGYNSKGILQEYIEKPFTFTNSHVLEYTYTEGDRHYLKGLAGVEYYSYSRDSKYVRGQGFPTYEFTQMQSAALITDATGSWTGFKRLGSFVQANYVLDSRFMASAIVRYDGSSRFGSNNRFGFFPAISLGWDLSKEGFIVDRERINQLKLRLGYGQTGNDQIGNFASRSLYGGGISYNGEAGIMPNSLGNSKLRWERNATTNLGVDYALFNYRIVGAIEVYQRKSKDLLLSKPVVWVGGYDKIVENLGEVLNQGVEFELGAKVINNKNFAWNSNFNISFQKNEVVKLYDDLLVLPGDESVRVGYSLMTHVMNQYAGVNPATGKAMWYDADGNITYNPAPMTGEAFAPYGFPNAMPKSFGGYNNEIRYKNISLGVFFQYDFGRVLYNNMGRTLGRKGDSQINTLQWYYDNRWQKEGQVTTVPRPINNAAEVGSARGDIASTRYLEDASYIRLKNLSLSYNFPNSVIDNIRLRSASIKLQANNLYTLTKFSGYDPEFNNANTGVIPAMKSFFISLHLGL